MMATTGKSSASGTSGDKPDATATSETPAATTAPEGGTGSGAQAAPDVPPVEDTGTPTAGDQTAPEHVGQDAAPAPVEPAMLDPLGAIAGQARQMVNELTLLIGYGQGDGDRAAAIRKDLAHMGVSEERLEQIIASAEGAATGTPGQAPIGRETRQERHVRADAGGEPAEGSGGESGGTTSTSSRTGGTGTSSRKTP